MNREHTDSRQENENAFLKNIVILFIFFIILFILLTNFGSIEHESLNSNSCVDIFNINFTQKDCDCDEPSRQPDIGDDKDDEDIPTFKPTQPSGNTDSKPTEPDNPDPIEPDEPDPVEPEPPVEDEDFVVYDDDTKYSYKTKLNIFTKSSSSDVANGKIAPGSTNIYNFVIRNNNEFEVSYDLVMDEINFDKVNMLYRLKLEGEYVVGDKDKWVKYDELSQYEMLLGAEEEDKYTLEWKWFDADNDTTIGKLGSSYTLNLTINAYI